MIGYLFRPWVGTFLEGKEQLMKLCFICAAFAVSLCAGVSLFANSVVLPQGSTVQGKTLG